MCIKECCSASTATGAKIAVVFTALTLLLELTACGQFAERQRKPDKSELNTGGPTTVVKKEPAYDPGELAGTEWTLASLNGHDLIKDSTITLDFEDGVGGSAGCNYYDTHKLETDEGAFKVGDILSTGTGCWRDVGRQESTYIRTLQKATTYRRQGDRLEIQNAAGKTTLVYAQRLQYHSDPADLVGTEWILHSMNGKPLAEGSTPTLSFDSEKRYSGYDGCQHFTGIYFAEADDISFPNISMTEPVCMKPGAYTDQERNIGVLPADGDYHLTKGRLEISTASEDTLVLVPLPEGEDTEEPGTAWVLEKFVEGRKATSVLRGTKMTLTFDRGTQRGSGTLYGSAGCNTYSADYVWNPRFEDFDFQPPVFTEKVCDEPAGIMEQEKRFLGILVNVHNYVLGDANKDHSSIEIRLKLATKDGGMLVFAPPE